MKNGKVKKIVSGLLLSTMMISTLAMTGCSNDQKTSEGENKNGKEMTTVNVHLPQASVFTQEGIAKVETEINNQMAERYHLQVKLNYIDLGNWTTQTNLALTTDECDVIALLNSPLTAYVNNGQLEPLTEYYESASEEMKATFTEQELAQTSYDGQLFSLPRKWWAGQESCLMMSDKILKELNVDPQSIDSIEKVDELLYEVHEKYPDIYTLVPGIEPSKLMDLWYFGDGMEDERARYGVVPMFDSDFDPNHIVPKSVFATETFMEISKYAYKWYQDGLVLKDVISNTIPGSTYIENGQAFGFLVRQQGTGYKPSVVTSGYTCSAPLKGSVSYSNTFNVVSYGISSNSTKKDDAWKVLEVLYTDPEIATLLVEGIEGENYELAEDGTAGFPVGTTAQDSTYGGVGQFWTYPNPMITHPTFIMGPEFKEKAEEYAQAVEYSPIIGFKWDYEGLEDEMAAVSKIYDQYYVPLISGLLNPEETIPQVLEELDQAGMAKILESQEKQLKEFMQSK